MANVHVITGRVIAVQENRLRLLADSGQALLLTVGTHARLASTLSDILRYQTPVRVEYTGEPNLACGIIRRVDVVE